AMINKSVSVRDAKTRRLSGKLRRLREIEIVRHQSIDDVIGESLSSRICRALSRTIPHLSDFQTRTDLGLLVRNVFDLLAAEYRNSRRQILTENFTLVMTD